MRALPGEAATPAGEPALERQAAPDPGEVSDTRRAPGLYVHVPFCDRVCPYCDFAVQTGGRRKRLAWADAMRKEIDGARVDGPSLAGAEPGRQLPPLGRFETVYLGGGTPSALAVETLGEVLATIRGALGVVAGAEVTLEANPEDVDAERAAAWRELGVTRVSIGAQSFDDDTLAVLGRRHDASRALDATRTAIEAGFDAVSVDLIFAVPGQSPRRWMDTLQRAVELRPHHLSCYELTVHEGTRFFRDRARGSLTEQADDAKASLFFATHRYLAGRGYPAYEVSNFARDVAFRSRHNSKYWDHTAYLGLGPSAHSFDGARQRWWNRRRLVDWAAAIEERGSGIAEAESLEARDLALEGLALGLRTADGVDLQRLQRRTGIDVASANEALLERLVAEERLLRHGTLIAPTLEGMALADSLAAAFTLPEPGEVT